MLHLMAEAESGINAGIHRLAQAVIDSALSDLDYRGKGKVRRDTVVRRAEAFFDPDNLDSALPLWACAAELDEGDLCSRARKIRGHYDLSRG